MSAAATIPLAIIAAGAPLGAIDVLYFHLWKFRLYDRPGSRAESVTHILRALILGGAVFLLATYEPHGLWFWFVGALFVFDFVNDVLDVVLEPASRRELGGVPPMEYLVHIIGSTGAGAAGAAFLVAGWPLASLPTELAPLSGTPEWLIAVARAVAASGFGLGALKAFLLIRSISKSSFSRP